MTTENKKAWGKGLNLQRGMGSRCIQEEKKSTVYMKHFCTNIMVTTHTQKTKLRDINLKKSKQKKNYRIPQKKTTYRIMGKRTNGVTELSENKRENGYRKSLYINNYPKCKWTKFTSKKAQRSRLNQKTKTNHILPSGNPSKLQRQIYRVWQK